MHAIYKLISTPVPQIRGLQAIAFCYTGLNSACLFCALNTNSKSMLQKTYAEIIKLLGQVVATDKIRNTNAVVLRCANGYALYSYRTLVAVRFLNLAEVEDTQYWFSQYHDYSRTTSKHVREFCGIDTRSRLRGIDTGKFGCINI